MFRLGTGVRRSVLRQGGSSVLSRLGRWSHDHRWLVVILWAAGLLLGNLVLSAAGGADTDADFSLPNVESKRGTDILEESFGGQGSGFGGFLVFEGAPGGGRPRGRPGAGRVFGQV